MWGPVALVDRSILVTAEMILCGSAWGWVQTGAIEMVRFHPFGCDKRAPIRFPRSSFLISKQYRMARYDFLGFVVKFIVLSEVVSF